jgi:hypothetical protein
MAKNFLSGLRLANLTSDPVSGSEGELYYNTVSDKVRIFSDGAWRDLSASTSGSLVNIDSIQYPDYIAFDITPESTSASVGTLAWDTGENNLSLQLTTNSNIGIGQELIVYCRNGEATQLNKGEVVRLSGASGQRPLVSRAYNLNDTGSALTVGIVNENIAAGAEGFIVTQGIVREINTNGFNEGDTLYVSASPGILTNIAPVAPQHLVIVGVVAKKNAASGRIYVKPINGFELGELHNVLTNGVTDGDVLMYNSSGSVWTHSPKQNIINTASAAAYASASAYTNTSLVPYLTQSSASATYIPWSASASLGGGGGGAAVDYQSNQPDVTGLAAGSLWIDSDQEAISGLLPATFTRWVKVLSASATTISGLDDNALSLLYTAGYEKVFINGTLLVRGSDYTASTGNTVVLTLPAETTDVIEIHSYESFQIADTYTQAAADAKFFPINASRVDRWTKTYSASATTITGTDDYSESLLYTSGLESVYINGVLVDPSEYTRTSASVITPLEIILPTDVVDIITPKAFEVANTYTQAQIDAKYNNRTRWTKTFSASATVISGADDNAINLSYTSGNEEVYLNGILLTPVTDYARTSASVITLSQAVVTNDIIDVVNIAPFNVANTYSQSQIDAKYNDYTRWTKTLSASATTISGTDNNSTTLSYTPGKEQVYINGSLIMRGTEYTASSGSTVVLAEAALVDDVIDIVSINPFNVANVYTQTQVDSKVGANGGMVLINKTDFSAASTITVDNCFSSTYKTYKIIIDFNLSAAQDLYLRLRSNGTTATGSDYIFNWIRGFSTTLQTGTSGAQNYWQIHYYSASGNGWAEIIMHNPFETSVTGYTSTWRSNQPALGLLAGTHGLTNSYNSFEFLPTGGTVTGTVKVYGLRNDV